MMLARLLISWLLELLDVLVALQRQLELLRRFGTSTPENHVLITWRGLVGGVHRRHVVSCCGVLLLEDHVGGLDGSNGLLVEDLAVHSRIALDAQLVHALLNFFDVLAAEGSEIAPVGGLAERLLVLGSGYVACHLDGDS